jgi:hypothetical protein
MRLIRWSQHALPVVLVVWLPSGAVGTPQYDGSYTGTIACEEIPEYTRGPLRSGFFLKIAGGQAEYERRHVRPTGAGLPDTERGTGTVSSKGEVALTSETSGVGGAYQATYRGQIDGKSLRLSGIQVWLLPGKANHQRPCAIDVSRSE